MPSCVFRHCTNYTATVRDKKNVSFHALPKDGIVQQKWLKVIRTQRCEDNWMPTAHSTVCSEHFFTKDLYITKNNIRRLKKTAVPVIEKHEEILWPHHEEMLPTISEDVSVSDEDSIFDTPTIAILKKKIRKISIDKRKLQVKNYNLARKNKRLKEICHNLKRIISNLKKNNLLQQNNSVIKTEAAEITN